MSGLFHHLKDNTRGDIKAGTASDPAVGEGRETGRELTSMGGLGQQTGDQYGGVQTGTGSFGTGENIPADRAQNFSQGGFSGSGNNDYADAPRYETAAATGGAAAGIAAGEGHHHHHHHHHNREGEGLTGSTNDYNTSGTTGSSGIGSGIGSGNESGSGYHTAATGTLGTGVSTATKEAPTGTAQFEEEPRDFTTGTVHHLHTVGTGAGTNSGIEQRVGITESYGSDSTARDYDNTTSGLTGGTGTGIGSGIGSGTSQYDAPTSGGSGVSGGTSDLSAGFQGRDTGGAGNMGVSDYQGREGAGPVSSGAAGTDRFDVDRSSSGITGGTGVSSNDHTASTLTRHGDDFTGGDTADSAYKSYDNTALTGRETSSTGVQDQHGESTAAEHSGGIMGKIKSLVGGHSNTAHSTQQ